MSQNLGGLFHFFGFMLIANIFFGHVTGGIFVPQTGIESTSPALKAQSLNHWTASEGSVAGIFTACRFYLKFLLCELDMVSNNRKIERLQVV